MNTVTDYCEGLKYENPDKFAHILPIIGSFHIEMSFMSVIYKRLKESNIENLLVEAGLIAQGSVVQALRDCDYNGATRLYKLFYGVMLRILITHGKKSNLQSCAKYIGNFLGFTENLDFKQSLTLLFGYFQQDNDKIEFLARRLGTRL